MEIITIVGVPILRSVFGWLENALADGKIELIEWKKLIKTVLKLGVPTAALYYGFNVPVEVSATIPLLVDYIFNWIKKLKKE